MKVTFVGLGNMGSGMARNILGAGVDLTVWNRTQSKMESFVEAGAKGAATVAEAVREADLVITSLMDDKSIEQCLNGEGQMLAAMKPGAIHLCVTTISPKFATYLYELHKKHGTHYVTGAVVGRPNASSDGTLTSLVAGDADAVKKIIPICETYSKKVTVVSEEPHAANVVKLGVNYLVISSIEAMSEVYTMAKACNVNQDFLADFFAEEIYAHPACKMYTKKIKDRDFDGTGGFGVTGGLKDIRLMIDTAKAQGVNLDIAKIIEGKMMDAINHGMGSRDWSSIHEVTLERAGLK